MDEFCVADTVGNSLVFLLDFVFEGLDVLALLLYRKAHIPEHLVAVGEFALLLFEFFLFYDKRFGVNELRCLYLGRERISLGCFELFCKILVDGGKTANLAFCFA